MSAEVVVVGSLVTDYITTTPSFPRRGETVFGHGLTIGFGGKGANQCFVAEKLGAKTAFVGKLGQDSVGDNFIAALKKTSIDISQLSRTSEAQSAVANVTVEDSGENCIVNIPGANRRMTADDVSKASELISNAKVLVCQNEITSEATKAALKIARQSGVTTILNAGPAIPDLDPEIISNTDILCVNETEAEVLSTLPVTSVESAVESGKKLISMGCRGALITLGDKGAVWVSGKDEPYQHVHAEKVKAVDTTGAGDAFIGALAFYIAVFPSLPFKEKMRRACCVATKSVQVAGAWNSFPSRQDLPKELLQL